MHVLAAFFCGEKHPSIAQGLYVSQCDQVAELRKVMDYVARTEDAWDAAAFTAKKRPLHHGIHGEGNIYSLERMAKNGDTLSLVLNNSEKETAYAWLEYDSQTIKSVTDVETGKGVFTKNGQAWLKLPPLSWCMVRFSSANNKTSAYGGQSIADENARIALEQAKLLSEKKENGFTYKNDGRKCLVIQLDGEVEVNGIRVRGSGSAAGTTAADTDDI